MLNRDLRNKSLYDDWEKTTAKLCEVGERANNYIENKYFSSKYMDFFSEHSSSVSEFKKIVSYRHQFWLNHPLRSQWIENWLLNIDNFIATSMQANNKLGLLKEYIWTKFSTLPLLISITNVSKKDLSKDIEKIIELMNAVECFFKEKTNKSNDLLIIQRTRLTAEVVKRTNKQTFLNVYQINLPKLKKNIFCEIIETWNFNKKKEGIDVCLPLSIGCVARCKMCEFSLFKPINIPINVLIQIIESQARNNYNAPFIEGPTYNFYYLGGGDALQYKELPSLLTYVAKMFSNPKQIISTIAFGTPLTFKSFLEKIIPIPNIGLQWSLNTFNEANRQSITGCSSLIPVQICINLLEEYYEKSQRKVTVSMMFFEPYSQDINRVKNDILFYLNPNIFKLNFANLQENSLGFSKQKSTHTLNKNLYDWAIENKYEATIDSPPEELTNELALCARTSSTVFNGNQPFLKEVNNE